MNDLERAFKALSGKLGTYNQLFDYFDGEQPLRFSTERLREAFGNIDVKFVQNWCAVVVNATLDRLTLKGFDAGKSTVNNAVDALWNENHLRLDSMDVHKSALVAGEGFIIAWKGDKGLDVYHNDPRLVHVFYEAARPKVKRFAAKWYVDENEVYHMTLYYKDKLKYFDSIKKGIPSGANDFKAAKTAEAKNPFEEIPVFHFKAGSDIEQILELQDAVNKLFNDMMVTAEFSAFPQRYVISNADTSTLKNGPNKVWDIPAGDGIGQQSSAGQFGQATLDGYLKAIQDLVNNIGIITRTPKHYLMDVGSGISGDALIAMEAPLVKKVEQLQERFGVVWKELGAFLLKLDGQNVDEKDLVPVWGQVRSSQPLAQAQAIQFEYSATVPLETSLRHAGWSTEEIQQMRKDKADAKKEQTAMAQALLEKMRLEQEQRNAESNSQANNNPPDQNIQNQ